MTAILYLWDADYPWDVRTEKVCSSLTRSGFEVHIVARNGKWRPQLERLEEATVHRMPPWKWMGSRLDRPLQFPAFFSPRWLRHLQQVVRQTRPGALIVRDLPLCPTAIWVGRHCNVPVIFDMAENYPALLQDIWDTGRQKPFDWLVRNPRAAAALERYCIPRVQEVMVVVEESAARVLCRGALPDHVSIVSNTPPLSRLREPTRGAQTRDGRPIQVVYMGLMELARGVGVLLQASTLMGDTGSRPRLHLIGGGRDLSLLQQQAQELGLSPDDAIFYRYIPSHAEALEIVQQADIGVIPHFANEWANTTIPNKLFDYMAAGLPVLSSDAVPCARIIRSTGAGRVFRDRDPMSLAAELTALRDPEERHRLATSGWQAMRDRYHWEYDERTLLEVLGRTLT